MGRFLPIYCARSDGKLETIEKGKRREPNEPTPEQLDTTPDKHGVSDYYREVKLDEVKSLDWRRKLGGMLARELNWNDSNTAEYGYMLVAFPENYRLYEHVKKTERDGKTEIKSKTHAGGGNDRQDAYLYGHPAGRRKRFRSPADFFPHLLWLVTDEEGDPDNCGCKICSPEDLENLIPGAKVKLEKPVKQPSDVKPAADAAATVTQPPKPGPDTPSSAGRPRSASQQLAYTPLPQPVNADQLRDRNYNNFMYRPGELVWFQRGTAWALGIILRRWQDKEQYHYNVQPLSYPGARPAIVTKSTESGFRPWLAWSVPKFTHDALNHLPQPLRYEEADWHGMAQNRYGHGEMEVDASILAAKAIDSSYTPFGVTSSAPTASGATAISYLGLYLGGEKVWLGDPLRLLVGTGLDIMILHSITNTSLNPTLTLTGDLYTLATAPHPRGNHNPNVPTLENRNLQFPHLPPRLVEDLRRRNAHSIAAKGIASFWKLVATQSQIGLDQVKGRWYEATLLLPTLDPSKYGELSRKGEILESSLWLNSRLDCQNNNRESGAPRVPRQNVFKRTRKEALGRAVPESTEIVEGVDPPAAALDPALAGGAQNMEIDARFDAADDRDNGEGKGEQSEDVAVETDVAGGGGGDGDGGGIDDFMNLDPGDLQPAFDGGGPDYTAGHAAQGSGFYGI